MSYCHVKNKKDVTLTLQCKENYFFFPLFRTACNSSSTEGWLLFLRSLFSARRLACSFLSLAMAACRVTHCIEKMQRNHKDTGIPSTIVQFSVYCRL